MLLKRSQFLKTHRDATVKLFEHKYAFLNTDKNNENERKRGLSFWKVFAGILCIPKRTIKQNWKLVPIDTSPALTILCRFTRSVPLFLSLFFSLFHTIPMVAFLTIQTKTKSTSEQATELKRERIWTRLCVCVCVSFLCPASVVHSKL